MDNSAANDDFFFFFATCTHCDLFRSSLLMIRSREKNQAYQDPFFRVNSISLCGTWTQLYLIVDVLYSQYLHTSCDFTWTSCPFSAETCGEKIAAKHMDAASFVSMRSASSAELFADNCGKKSQRTDLA